MGPYIPDIPDEIARFCGDADWTRVAIGRSKAEVYCISRSGRPVYYLKGQPRGEDLARERDVLAWLNGRLNAPAIAMWQTYGERDYLLTTAIPGTDAATVQGTTPEMLVRAMAQGLRAVHRVASQGCPFDWSLDRMLEMAKANITKGHVDESDFDLSRLGMTAADVYAPVLAKWPAAEPAPSGATSTSGQVFTHGDASLPNVIIYRGQVSGYVDWGKAGIGDRYRDLAISVRSIRDNLGQGLEGEFFHAYGLDPDWAKIEFYILMDEFF